MCPRIIIGDGVLECEMRKCCRCVLWKIWDVHHVVTNIICFITHSNMTIDLSYLDALSHACAFDTGMSTCASPSLNVLDQVTYLGVLAKSLCCLEIFVPHAHNSNLFASLTRYVSSNYLRPKRRTGSFTPSSVVSRWWMSLSIPARSSIDSSVRLLLTATHGNKIYITEIP